MCTAIARKPTNRSVDGCVLKMSRARLSAQRTTKQFCIYGNINIRVSQTQLQYYINTWPINVIYIYICMYVCMELLIKPEILTSYIYGRDFLLGILLFEPCISLT
jgi:hypothetical protein